jgi:uncharacterized repeat protein (TIGR03803 family)
MIPLNSKIIRYDATSNTLTAAYSFGGDAGFTESLMEANNGILYGSAPLGDKGLGINGSFNDVIFSFNPITSQFAILFEFSDNNQSIGASPNGGLFQGNDGKLYGTTYGGGTGAGVIFSVDPANGAYTKLKSLDRGSNGNNPIGGLFLASNGKFYGTTVYGGSNNKGVIFSFDPLTSVYTKLVDFTGINGYGPWHNNLMEASNGKLYGMTQAGGSYDLGVIFTINLATSVYTKIKDFDGSGGAYPNGCLIQANDGKLYGTAVVGGNNNTGVIFSLDPSNNTYTKLIDFSNGNDGRYPQASLVQASDGKLYGMTHGDANNTNNNGSVYSFDLVSSLYTKLSDFDGNNGSNSWPSESSLTEIGAMPHIKTVSLTSLSYCQGASVNIHYITSGPFKLDNTFTAQLSDASGSFSSPTSIGSTTGITNGNLNATIPANTPLGSGYRIRVIANNPAVNGDDNGSNFSISPAPTVSCTNSNSVLYFGYTGDQTVTVTGTPNGGTGPYNVSITMDRPLMCNVITTGGNEIWAGGVGTISNSNTTCPSSGTLSSPPISSTNNIATGGTYSVTATLMTDAVFTITVTDALGSCNAICTTKVHAEDVRCFAGNSSNSKITLCHQTGDPKKPCITMCVDQSAVQEHLNHGDFLGNCTANCLPLTLSINRAQGLIGTESTKINGFDIKALPNPSSNRFTLKVESDNIKEKLKVRVVDVSGKVIEVKTNVFAGQTLQIGSNYRPGIYMVEAIQGKERKTLKLIKQ